jgi:penicillin-binding protein 1B
MTWQATKERLQLRLASARAWLATHVTRKRVLVGVVLAATTMLFALSVEAMLRARLGDPASRVPTSLYTRQVGWDGRESEPIAIGSLNGNTLESRVPVPLDEIPVHLIDAVLAVEDQRFFDHEGLDVKRIGGAFVANVKARGISQGGSTITQQLAKNLFLGAERTPLRKLREAAIATVLEARYSKEQILEAYLNEVYLGHDNGAAIHGVGAASRFYFGKDVQRVVLSEAATLAAMIRAPNRLAPHRHPEAARDRRNLVLQLMVEQGRVPARSRDQSSQVPVPRRVHPRRTMDGRWFRDHALEGAPRGLPSRGGAVYTTLDATLQRAAERAVAANPGAPQAALVAIDPRTGDILAMVGGRDYGASQFNRATDALRQPGSAFKPIVALAALERNDDGAPSYTLASTLDDSPLAVRTPQGPWRPANYDGTYRGEVTLRQAMEQSLNIPFARIGLELGPERIVATARRLGITSRLQEVPSLALGASEVTLLELVRAYGALANGGELASSRRILARAHLGQAVDAVTEPQLQRVADPAAVWLVTSALQGVVSNGTGRGLGRYGVAGKTGTSNDWRDAWFIAYTPDLVVGVWVGHDDGRSLRQTGGIAAVPIVSRFMGFAGIRASRFEIPEGVVQSYTGGGGWFSPCGQREYFLEGTSPGNNGCWQFDMEGDGDSNNWGENLRRRAEEWVRERLRDAEQEIR